MESTKDTQESRLELAQRVMKRWHGNQTHSTGQFEEAMADYDVHMLRMGKRFSKSYSLNIYKLNQVSYLLQKISRGQVASVKRPGSNLRDSRSV